MINESNVCKYCRDDISKIENYDKAIADTSQTWVIHHRLELTLDGEFALTPEQLKMHDMYYSRPYYELIFLTRTDHIKLHNSSRTLTTDIKSKISKSLTGKSLSEEHRRKIAESLKGDNNPFYGKHHSVDTRRKWSEIRKGRTLSEEHRRKIAESLKGRISPMKGRTISAETRNKLSESHKGKVPWNKGKKLSEEHRKKLSESHKLKEIMNKEEREGD